MERHLSDSVAFTKGILAFANKNKENCKVMNVLIDVEEEGHATRTRVDGWLILRYHGQPEV